MFFVLFFNLFIFKLFLILSLCFYFFFFIIYIEAKVFCDNFSHVLSFKNIYFIK